MFRGIIGTYYKEDKSTLHNLQKRVSLKEVIYPQVFSQKPMPTSLNIFGEAGSGTVVNAMGFWKVWGPTGWATVFGLGEKDR